MVYSKNAYLTQEEMTVNAQYIMDHLTADGWTPETVAGMLGNMETESTINPGIWQGLNQGNMSGGFGLVQWTPATKFTDWADANGYAWGDIEGQLARIEYEINNGIQWIASSDYPITFEEFRNNTADLSVEELAEAFLLNYERPADQTQPMRGTQARDWYESLDLSGGGTPDFIYPSDCTNITSGFRPPDRPDHMGLDFACGDGTYNIYASAAGTVSRSYTSTTYGEVIFIEHTINGQLYETVYAHMAPGSRLYTQGESVAQGAIIGIMGNTGDSSGMHLHFELHVGQWNEGKTNAVDPLPYLEGTNTDPDPEPNKTKDIYHLLLSGVLPGW